MHFAGNSLLMILLMIRMFKKSKSKENVMVDLSFHSDLGSVVIATNRKHFSCLMLFLAGIDFRRY